MADHQKLRPFASIYPSQTPEWVHLPSGVTAFLRHRHFDDASFSLPAFEEHVLFIHLSSRARAWLSADREFESDWGAGDTTIIPRGYATQWRIVGTTDILVLILPSSGLVGPLQHAAWTDVKLQPNLSLGDLLIYGIGRVIVQGIQCEDQLNGLYLDSLLIALVMHLTCRHGATTKQVARPAGQLAPETLRCVTDYIESKLEYELSLTQLAQLVQYSPYHFARCFRNTTGQPLHQYILARRLARARYMLEATDLCVADIAQQTGFTDHSHLTSHFRRAYHMTPVQLRRDKGAGVTT